jgi:flavin-dependent dehydrogenase
MNGEIARSYDVVIIGAGLAGLTLSRHLLLYTDKTVLLLDKRANPPRQAPQKVGESLVQLGGYYFSKVLDLEEYLLTDHFLKYNLRFYWVTEGLENRYIEDYSQSFPRLSSNIAAFQFDRNDFEEHLLRINQADPRCQFLGGVRNLAVDLSSTGDLHRVRFEHAGDPSHEVYGRWLVDASGRGKVLKRQLGMAQESPIRHAATFCWVDGVVDIEKITKRTRREILHDASRRKTGHFPFFLATSHFCAEGQWFWMIPLHHKTSLGLVYDTNILKPEEVSNPRKLIDYVCRTWPLLANDLPNRKILDQGRLIDFSYDCRQTISPERWALVGESGRFSDPLYSPGSDLISIYNTLVVDAIQTKDSQALQQKCEFAEFIERLMYEAYVPGYAFCYDSLGSQETFTLKYSWELSVYFCFYVLPMINNLFADYEFMGSFLRRFEVVGPINHNLQECFSAFFQWRKKQPPQAFTKANLIELYDMEPLRDAEKLFYEVGLSPQELLEVVDRFVERLKEFARYILAHIHASVIGSREVLTNAPFIAGLSLQKTVFDPAAMRAAYDPYAGSAAKYSWDLNPFVLERFIRPIDSSQP